MKVHGFINYCLDNHYDDMEQLRGFSAEQSLIKDLEVRDITDDIEDACCDLDEISPGMDFEVTTELVQFIRNKTVDAVKAGLVKTIDFSKVDPYEAGIEDFDYTIDVDIDVAKTIEDFFAQNMGRA